MCGRKKSEFLVDTSFTGSLSHVPVIKFFFQF